MRFGKDYKNKRIIAVIPDGNEDESVEYSVPKGKHIPVQEGDFVRKGEYIMDGNPAPHDILAIMGVEALAEYMINEVQDVYNQMFVDEKMHEQLKLPEFRIMKKDNEVSHSLNLSKL